MPKVRNAFKLREADNPVLETSQFLQLYCPLLLGQIQQDDLNVPKLLVIRGSPGSGKSSLLRLFEIDTLLAVHARRLLLGDQDLAEKLEELGVLAEDGPRVVGIYIQCDSSLRDVSYIDNQDSSKGLFNALLDARIVGAFLRGVKLLQSAGCLAFSGAMDLEGLPPEETPPNMFAQTRSLNEIEDICLSIEREFSVMLNSFPGDPLLPNIQPHSRMYAPTYITRQLKSNTVLGKLMPIIMLDDVQELYPDQRKHLNAEFLRRTGVSRWLAVRTHVYGLEQLISLEGANEGREYREIKLDEIFSRHPSVFSKFSANVVQRRLQASEYLDQTSVSDFRELLDSNNEDTLSVDRATKALESMLKQASGLRAGRSVIDAIEKALGSAKDETPALRDLTELERLLILAQRQSNRMQLSLFPDDEVPIHSDSKTAEAARLFAAKRTQSPYYSGFTSLTEAASFNVEQLLWQTSRFADRMVHRAELDRNLSLSAKEQEDMLRECADEYFDGIETRYRRGPFIRQLVDNLGRFCEEVTYRSNAPIAPGVSGFGLTKTDILKGVMTDSGNTKSVMFREVLTNAVAGNVLSVRTVRQGQPGVEKIVFYLNRLLCLKYRLPLNYGGWQPISDRLLVEMMERPVSPNDVSKGGTVFTHSLWEGEELEDG